MSNRALWASVLALWAFNGWIVVAKWITSALSVEAVSVGGFGLAVATAAAVYTIAIGTRALLERFE